MDSQTSGLIRQSHMFEGRRSPPQFIDTPSASGHVPHALYAGGRHIGSSGLSGSSSGLGPMASRLSSHLQSSPGITHHSSSYQGSNLSSQLPLSSLQNRSTSSQSIQSMLQERAAGGNVFDNLLSVNASLQHHLDSGDSRPRSASARDQPLLEIAGNDPLRRIRDPMISPRASSVERGGLSSIGHTLPQSARTLVRPNVTHDGMGNLSRIGGLRSQSYEFSLDKDDRIGGGILPSNSSGYASSGSVVGPTISHPNSTFGTMVDKTFAADQGNMVFDYSSTDTNKQQQELELTKEKLNSCLNSIKTFWSPELKRERALRKEENAKYALLADHLHQLQLEKETLISTIHNLENEIRKLREGKSFQTEPEVELLKRRCQEMEKDNRLLAKHQEELERRCSSQKAALSGQEDGIRRLMDMVKGKGVRVEDLEHDRMEIDRLRGQVEEYSARVMKLDSDLVQKDMECNALKEELESTLTENRILKKENESLLQDARQAQTLQALIETKDSKMLTLESEIRLLEDEITRLRDDGMVTPTTSTTGGIEDFDKTVTTFRNNERMLKSKMDMLNTEITKRDSEIYALQSRLEMSEKQQQDHSHHINVLKEQVKSREHKVSMLTTDVEDLRKRIKEKEMMIEKKTKQVTSAQSEKRQMEAELVELRDQTDIKDRKLSVLQRKIENLEDLLNDKENQLTSAKSRLASLHSENSSTEGTRSALEESLREKDRQIERLREQKNRQESDNQEEINMQKKLNSDMRTRLDSVQREVEDKQKMILELREEISEIKSERFKRETEMSQLQAALSQKNSELSSLQTDMQMLKKQAANETELKTNQKITELESQLSHYIESATKLQSEVDRLINLLKNSDEEKLNVESHLHEYQEQLKEAHNQINSLKRSQQTDRKKNSQLLEEAKRREDNVNADTEILRSSLEEKESRIAELEHALKESVKISAEREMYSADREERLRQMEQQLYAAGRIDSTLLDQRQTLDQLMREKNHLSNQLSSIQEELRDKEAQLKTLETECFQGYIPELEKLRKANQELLSRNNVLERMVQSKDTYLSNQDRMALQNSSSSQHVNSSNPNLYLSSNQNLPTAHSGLGGGATTPFSQSQTSAFQMLNNNQEKTNQLNRLLQEKEQQLREQSAEIERLKRELSHEVDRVKRDLNSTLSERESQLDRIKRELNSTITDRDTHISILNNDLERLKLEKTDLNNNLMVQQQELREKSDKFRMMETDLSKYKLEFDSLQKKYQSVLGQLTDKNDRIQALERECFHVQADEIKHLRNENDEVLHRLSFMQKSLNDRDTKLDQLEKDHFKQREDLSILRKQLHNAESELKTFKEELAYREDRIKQLQNSHNDEVVRLRSLNQDVSARLNEMKAFAEEKENIVKVLASENDKMKADYEHTRRRLKEYENEISILNSEILQKEEKIKLFESEYLRIQNEEVQHYQKAVDEANSRLNVLQKRCDEREQRLKKIEQENVELLDEIHSLRKRNHDVECQLDSAKQLLIEKEELGAPSRSNSSIDMGYSSQISSANSIEIERLRKQYSEVTFSLNQMQKLLDESQIQYDQLLTDRDNLIKQINEERIKSHQLQQSLHEKDIRLRRFEAESTQPFKRHGDDSSYRSRSQYASPIRESPSLVNQLRYELSNRDQQFEQLCQERDQIQKDLNEERQYSRQLQQTIAEKDSRIQLLDGDVRSTRQDSESSHHGFNQTDEFEQILSERNTLQTQLNDEKLKCRRLQQQISDMDLRQSPSTRSMDGDMLEQLRQEKESLQKQLNDERSEKQHFQKTIRDKDIQISDLEHEMLRLNRSTPHAESVSLTAGNYTKQQMETKDRQLEQLRNEKSNLQRQYNEEKAHNQQLQKTIRDKEIHISELENELLRKSRSTPSQDISQVKQQMESQNKQIEQLKIERETFQRQLNEERNTTQQLQKVYHEKESQFNNLQNEMIRQSRTTPNQDQNTQMKQQIDSLVLQLDQLRNEKDTIQRQVYEERSQTQQFQNSIKEKDLRIKDLESQLIYYQKQARDTPPSGSNTIADNTTVNQLKQQLDSREQQHNQLSMELDMLHKQLTEEKDRNSQFQLYIQESEMHVRKLENELAQKQSELAQLQMTGDDPTGRLAQMQNALQTKEHQIQQLTQELERCILENQELFHKVTSITAERDQVMSQAQMHQPAVNPPPVVPLPPQNNQEMQKAAAMQSEANNRISYLENEIAKCQEEIQKSQEEHRTTMAKLDEAQQQLNELEAGCKELIKENDALHLKLQTHDTNAQNAPQNNEKVTELTEQLKLFHQEKSNLVKENEQLNSALKEIQNQSKEREKRISQMKEDETEKMSVMQTETANQVSRLQKELESKSKQVKDLTVEIKNLLEDNKELSAEINTLEKLEQEVESREQETKKNFKQLQIEYERIRGEYEMLMSEREEIEDWANQMRQELNLKDNQIQDMNNVKKIEQERKRVSQDMTQQNGVQRELNSKIEDLHKQLDIKDKQITHLTGQFEQMVNEISDQQETIKDLHKQLEAFKFGGAPPPGGQGANPQELQRLQQSAKQSQEELREAKKTLQERDSRIHTLETQCFQQQAEEIECLRQELQKMKQTNGQQSISRSSSQDSHDLKAEVDQLKREIAQRVDVIQRMEKDCQEKHLKRLDAQQAKIKRMEEESSSIGKILEDQKKAIEERDRLIKQIRADSNQATSVDLERLREEHAHCGEVIRNLQKELQDQNRKFKSDMENLAARQGQGGGADPQMMKKLTEDIAQKTKRIKNLELQLDRQMEEVLQLKQEALTASMCEKDANIALMEMTGVHNAQTDKAVEALRSEKSNIQTQLKQLTQALANMKEQKMSETR